MVVPLIYSLMRAGYLQIIVHVMSFSLRPYSGTAIFYACNMTLFMISVAGSLHHNKLYSSLNVISDNSGWKSEVPFLDMYPAYSS